MEQTNEEYDKSVKEGTKDWHNEKHMSKKDIESAKDYAASVLDYIMKSTEPVSSDDPNLQPSPERDEHGCIIGKEKFDEVVGKCVIIEEETEKALNPIDAKLKAFGFTAPSRTSQSKPRSVSEAIDQLLAKHRKGQ